MLCSGVSNEGLCQISKSDSLRNQRNKNSKKLMSMLLFLMSQASYNLVTSAPMLIPQFQLAYVHDPSVFLLLSLDEKWNFLCVLHHPCCTCLVDDTAKFPVKEGNVSKIQPCHAHFLNQEIPFFV